MAVSLKHTHTHTHTQSMSYHGADHAADVDGVTASRDIVSRVLQVFVVLVQYLKANLHHVVLKLDRETDRKGDASYTGFTI